MGSKSSKEDGAQDEIKTEGGPGSNPFISSKRKCTDLICIILFAIFWVGMLVIAGLGYSKGQPEKLIYGVDWKGRTCGTKGDTNGAVPAYDLTEYKHLAYPRLTEDLFNIQMSGGSLTDPNNLKRFFGVCVRECPDPLDNSSNPQYIHAYNSYVDHPEPVNTDSNAGAGGIENTLAGSPWRVDLNSTSMAFRCISLDKMNTTAYVRCVDPCASGATSNCGTDLTTNPFVPCGSKGCDRYIEDNLPKCKTSETREIIDTVGSAKSNPVFDMLNGPWQTLLRWVGDIEKASVPILVCGGVVAAIIAFSMIFLLQYCAGCFVWLTIILVWLMLLASTFFSAFQGGLLNYQDFSELIDKAGLENSGTIQDIDAYVNKYGKTAEEDKQKYWAFACYVFIAVDIVVFLLLFFLFSRIKIAIGIVKEAAKSIRAMPLMVMFPIFPVFGIFCLTIYWIITAAYVATSGSITLKTFEEVYDTNTTKFELAEYEDDNVMTYLLVYHFFGFLWTNQFIQAFGYMTIAGAVAEYYWTLDKTTIQRLPVVRSLKRTLRYHLGSLAFGSLIIAVIQLLRAALEYIDHKTKSAQEGNKMVKVLIACLKCFLWCFEKCMKFININAYIIVAMKGCSFCSAMKDAFQLLLANAARVATVGIISTFLLFLCKLMIVALSCLCMFMFIYYPPKGLPSFFTGDIDEISSPIFPMILTAIMSFGVSTLFIGVFETAIDTILLCFCEDCRVNQATGTYYMSDDLLTYIDGTAKKNAFRHFKRSDANDKGNQV